MEFVYFIGCCCGCIMRATRAVLPPFDCRCSTLPHPSCTCWAWRNTQSFTSDATTREF